MFLLLEIKADNNVVEKKDENNNIDKSGNEQMVNEEKKENNNEINENKIEEEKKNNEADNKNIINDNNLDSNRRINSDIIKESSSLLIEEMDCNILNGQKIKINAQGMIGGRGQYDGVSIFSCKTNAEQNEQSFKSDFILNCDNKYSYPYIFMIYFEKEQKSYYIRPYIGKIEEKIILYIKLNHENSYPLKQKEVIFAGNIIFQISPIDNNNLEIANLSKDNLSSTPKQTFNPSSIKEVTIGRNKDCNFVFQGNKSFSRIHTTFEYDEENKEWVIIDGSKAKSSTNGTWIFCAHSFQIKNSMIIEIMNNRLHITEENNNE